MALTQEATRGIDTRTPAIEVHAATEAEDPRLTIVCHNDGLVTGMVIRSEAAMEHLLDEIERCAVELGWSPLA